MEKLVYVVLGALLIALLVCGGGLWLLHTAINEGNVWKGMFGAMLALGGGLYAALLGGGLAAAR